MTLPPPVQTALPADPALPGLSALQDPGTLRELLMPVLKGEELLRVDFEVIRHVAAKRCLLELTLTTSSGNTRLLAKTYSKGRGARMHEALRQLFVSGFGAGEFLVCEPMGYDQATDTCFFAKADGVPLADLLLNGGARARDFENAGAWLGKMHGVAITNGRKYDLSRHLYTLGIQGASLAAAAPATADGFSRTLRLIAAHASLLDDAAFGPTHRDFSPHHLLCASDCVTGIDLDEFCQYYQLFDVAHFIAHVRLMALYTAGSVTGFDRHVAAFLEGYGRQVTAMPAYHLLAAAAYLKTAHIAGSVHRREGAGLAALLLLKEAQACIARC